MTVWTRSVYHLLSYTFKNFDSNADWLQWTDWIVFFSDLNANLNQKSTGSSIERTSRLICYAHIFTQKVFSGLINWSEKLLIIVMMWKINCLESNINCLENMLTFIYRFWWQFFGEGDYIADRGVFFLSSHAISHQWVW